MVSASILPLNNFNNASVGNSNISSSEEIISKAYIVYTGPSIFHEISFREQGPVGAFVMGLPIEVPIDGKNPIKTVRHEVAAIVKEAHGGGQAARSGIKNGDIIYFSPKAEGDPVRVMTYHDFVRLVKSPTRPVKVLVRRFQGGGPFLPEKGAKRSDVQAVAVRNVSFCVRMDVLKLSLFEIIMLLFFLHEISNLYIFPTPCFSR